MKRFEFISAGKKANIEGASLLQANTDLYIEEKFDGSRFGLELDTEGVWHAWSRNGIDRIKNIPYIEKDLNYLNLPRGTVLDCEVVVLHEDRSKHWELSRAVMGTKAYTEDAPKATLIIFDVQRYGDSPCKNVNYIKRRELLWNIIIQEYLTDTLICNGYLAMPRAWKITKLEEIWDLVVTKGNGEGLMLKHNSSVGYGRDWTKVKKEATADAFILSATPGKGKFEGQIGALELAVLDNSGVIWPIGKCSGMDDSTRLKMTDMALAGSLKNKVIEVKFNEVTKNKKLRHPRFIRWRDDKTPKECLLGQL